MEDAESIKNNLLGKLAKELDECKRCELTTFGGKPFVGIGNLNAKLLLVGEAPTSYAERQRRPLIGGTGSAIDKWLNYLGIEREQVFMTNAVKCVLRDKPNIARTNGYGPYGHQLSACRHWLKQEIEIVEPIIVLTVGAAALNSLIGKSISVFHINGYCQQIGNRFYCAMYHPARHAKPLDEGDKRVLDNILEIMKRQNKK